MTSEKFDAIVQRLTKSAERQPRWYFAKVALLAGLGYFYLILVLLLSLVLLGGLAALAVTGKGLAVVVKLGLVVLYFLWTILRALWVTLPAPEGRRLTRQEAPALFAVLDEFRVGLGAPRFHEVVVNAEFNAAVVQIPRLGIFGWHRNYLLLGLPFMEGMPAEEFKAVLAHEYGHLASGHAAFSNWIYRQRVIWQRVADELASRGQGGWVIGPFLKRFAPYFNAYSFVLARGNEYVADHASVRLVGAKTTANALLRSEVIGRFLAERVYPAFYRQATFAPAPPSPLGDFLRQQLTAGPSPADATRWMMGASARRTDSTDTHPAFTDRVAAVGAIPDLPGAARQTAASAFLGEALVLDMHRAFSAEWELANREAWQERFAEAQKSRVRLAELEPATQETAAWEPAWERAVLVEALRSAEAALPLFRALHERDPRHAGAAYAVGRLLLGQGNPDGVGYLEHAMASDWKCILPACELLHAFYLERNNAVEAQQVMQRARRQQDKLQAAGEERAGLERSLVCEPHGLDAQVIAAVTDRLRAHKAVHRVWLVRKRLQHFPDEPLLVLGFKVPWYHLHLQEYYAKLCQQLASEIKLPGQFFVVSFDSGYGWLLGRAGKIPGALIYRRS